MGVIGQVEVTPDFTGAISPRTPSSELLLGTDHLGPGSVAFGSANLVGSLPSRAFVSKRAGSVTRRDVDIEDIQADRNRFNNRETNPHVIAAAYGASQSRE